MTPEWAQVFVSVGQTMLIVWGIWLMRFSNQEPQATSEMLCDQATMLRSQVKTLDAHTEGLKEQTALLREQAATQNDHTDAPRRLLEERDS